MPSMKRQKARGKPKFRDALGAQAQAGEAALSCPALPLPLPPPIEAQTCLPAKQQAPGITTMASPAPRPLTTAHSAGVSAPLPLGAWFLQPRAQRGHRQPGFVHVVGVTTPIALVQHLASFPWPEEGEPAITPISQGRKLRPHSQGWNAGPPTLRHPTAHETPTWALQGEGGLHPPAEGEPEAWGLLHSSTWDHPAHWMWGEEPGM